MLVRVPKPASLLGDKVTLESPNVKLVGRGRAVGFHFEAYSQ